MATVKEMLIDSLSKANRAAEQITTNVERAAAFTELAKACAAALSSTKDNDNEIPKAEEKSSKKDSIKQSVPKVKKEPEVVENDEPEVTEEPEEVTLTEEWTAQALELLAPEMAALNKYYEMFADNIEDLNMMISEATEGVVTDKDGVTPLNIKLVIAYLRAKEEEAAESEE